MGKGKGIYVILAIIALAAAYYFLIHKKRKLPSAVPGGTPAAVVQKAKKKGGWRSRLGGFAKSAVKGAAAATGTSGALSAVSSLT